MKTQSANTSIHRLIASQGFMALLLTLAFFLGLGSLLVYLGWAPAGQLSLIGGLGIVAVLWMSFRAPESLVRVVLLGLVRVFYPIRRVGVSHIPKSGGVLIVSNHVSYVDALLIYATAERPVRFVGADEMLRYPWMRWTYQRFGVIAVSPTRAKDAVRKTVEALRAGEVVCLFPEGALTRTGMLMPFKKGAELIARLAKAPVVPACIDGMWGSAFSFAGKPFRWRRGMPLRRPVQVLYSEPLEGKAVAAQSLHETVLALSCEAFSNRPVLQRNLGRVLWDRLARRPFVQALVDRSAGRRQVSAVRLAAVGLSFSRIIKGVTAQARLGVILPPGLAGAAVNLGALWAGVSAVNLNPTVSREFFRAQLQGSGVDTVFTSRAFLKRFEGLPLEDVNVVFMEDLVKGLSKPRLAVDLCGVALLPARASARLFDVPSEGGDREATLLFSSGSTAAPKGIPLSHANLLANALELSECYLMNPRDKLLANLPYFHSFGLTGGLFMPLLQGIEIVATPSPLQIGANAKVIAEEKASVVLGTPTFLRGYLRKATAEDFGSVRLTLSGAENLPEALRSAWEKRFGSPILEGYGLTECSPVIAVNCLESRECLLENALEQSGRRPGTVGRPLPGCYVRIVSRDGERRTLPAGQSGLIWVKSPSVFKGYLDDSLSADRFEQDGWFNTEDIGSIDDQGFLAIEGRESRFSKIGGEMVSHVSVEQSIERAYPEWSEETGPLVVVMGRPSSIKGESLVALTKLKVDLSDMRSRLQDMGVSNLWIPKEVVRLGEIPCLATGKIDLKRCREAIPVSAKRNEGLPADESLSSGGRTFRSSD